MMLEIEEKSLIQINLELMIIIEIMLIIIKEITMMEKMNIIKKENKINIIKNYWTKLRQIKS